MLGCVGVLWVGGWASYMTGNVWEREVMPCKAACSGSPGWVPLAALQNN